MPNKGSGWIEGIIMKTKEFEQVAVCRVLLDIMTEMESSVPIENFRHYQTLKEKVGLTEAHFEKAYSVSVLSSLVTLKSMHYNKKMLLALTICDIYSDCTDITLHHRLTFDTLMNAIEWTISFSEILAISRTDNQNRL